MPVPKSKEQYEKELRDNIKMLRGILGGEGLGADDEIIVKNMLSGERMNIHEDFQKVEDVTDKEHIDIKIANASKYFQADSVHKAVKRNWGSIAHEEKTQEDVEYNKRMFSNLSRDDEMGIMARENFYLENLNKTFEIDPETFTQENLDKMSEREFAEFCAKNADAGYTMFELQHSTGDFGDEFTITNEKKFQAAHHYGTTIGGVLKDNTWFVKSDGFLTLPLQYLSDKQLDKVMEQASFRNPLIPPEMSTTLINSLTIERGKREMSKAVEELRQVTKPGEKFTSEDYKYTLPVEERQYGGYYGRKEAIIQGCDAIQNLTSEENPEKLEEIKVASAKIKSVLSSVDGLPDEQQQAQIKDAISSRNKLIYNFNKPLYNATDPNVIALRDNLKKNMTISGFFAQPNNLKDQVAYAKEDAVEFEKNDNGIDKSLKDLNSLYDGLRVVNPDGQKETMTSSDIYEIRNKIAEIIKKADEAVLAGSANKNVIDRFNRIKNNTLKQLKAMNRAEPGMTIDDALAGNARMVDITGHSFKTMGNASSERQMMTITGADGVRTAGFFTENRKINMATAMKSAERNAYESYPNADKKLIGQMFEYFNETSNINDCHFDEFEKKCGVNMPDEMVNIFGAVKENVLKAQNEVLDYQGALFAPDDAVISARNIAMSDVAALVGAGDCLAKSTPLTVVNNGNAVEGCFMESVQGEDLLHLTKDSPFLKIDDVSAALDYSPALKQLSDMQVVDFICGNRDRHGGNILYQFDENGKISGVKGIDNDLSFMSIDQAVGEKMTAPENMKYISSSMAEKLEHTTPEMLKMTLEGSGLINTEIDFAVDRFNQLKSAIKDNKVEIMPDEDFAKHKMKDFCGDYPTIFSNVQSTFNEKVKKATPEALNNLPDKKVPPKENVVDMFRQIDNNQVKQTIEPLENMLSGINEAKKGVYFGSEKYKNVEAALKTVIDASKKMSENGKLANDKTFDALNKAYKQLEKISDIYVKSKISTDKPNLSAKTARRVAAASRVRDFCRNMSKSLEKSLEMDKSLQARSNEKVTRAMIDGLDPQTAGMYLKEMNKIALNVKSTPKQILEAAQGVKNVARYMQEKHVTAEECGLTKDDMLKAQNSIKIGRKTAEQINPQAVPKQIEKKEQGMQLA